MKNESVEHLQKEQSMRGTPYFEFIRTKAMSIGLYALRVGEFDRQKPHREDEVYLVVSGRARFTDSQKTTDVQPGQIIYVTAGMPHRFHAITEDLQLIVVFAPPES